MAGHSTRLTARSHTACTAWQKWCANALHRFMRVLYTVVNIDVVPDISNNRASRTCEQCIAKISNWRWVAFLVTCERCESPRSHRFKASAKTEHERPMTLSTCTSQTGRSFCMSVRYHAGDVCPLFVC